MHTTEQIMMANELAETLRDFHSTSQYLKLTTEFTSEELRMVLGQVMSIPQEKITRSRGALFTHLIRQYGRNKKHFGN